VWWYRQIEKLERFCIAYQYTKHEEEVSRSQDEFEGMQKQLDRLEFHLHAGGWKDDHVDDTCLFMDSLKAEAEKLRGGVTKRQAELGRLQDVRKKDYEKVFQKAKSEEESLSKDLVKANTVRWDIVGLQETQTQ